jgi:hypothetical protein
MPELTLASCKKVQLMKKEVGLWIDHKQAVIVTLVDQMEETKRIISDIEKQVRYSGASRGSHDDTTEIRRDRRFDDHLGKYYDEVIACLRDADSILIFGPVRRRVSFKNNLRAKPSVSVSLAVKPRTA